MHTDRILKLAARLRAPEAEDHFDLAQWFNARNPEGTVKEELHRCGTVACIAGWASAMANPNGKATLSRIHFDRAKEWLDLDGEMGRELMWPSEDLVDYDKVTASIAADVLENLARTGKVVWP